MLLWIIKRARRHPPHSMIVALADWCLLALFFGFRLSEFLQLQSNIKANRIQRNQDGRPQAFILSDITFYGPNKSVLRLDHRHPVDSQLVHGFALKWRYQKICKTVNLNLWFETIETLRFAPCGKFYASATGLLPFITPKHGHWLFTNLPLPRHHSFPIKTWKSYLRVLHGQSTI